MASIGKLNILLSAQVAPALTAFQQLNTAAAGLQRNVASLAPTMTSTASSAGTLASALGSVTHALLAMPGDAGGAIAAMGHALMSASKHASDLRREVGHVQASAQGQGRRSGFVRAALIGGVQGLAAGGVAGGVVVKKMDPFGELLKQTAAKTAVPELATGITQQAAAVAAKQTPAIARAAVVATAALPLERLSKPATLAQQAKRLPVVPLRKTDDPAVKLLESVGEERKRLNELAKSLPLQFNPLHIGMEASALRFKGKHASRLGAPENLFPELHRGYKLGKSLEAARSAQAADLFVLDDAARLDQWTRSMAASRIGRAASAQSGGAWSAVAAGARAAGAPPAPPPAPPAPPTPPPGGLAAAAGGAAGGSVGGFLPATMGGKLAVGGTLVALGAVATAGATYEKEMSRVKALTEATSAQMDQMGKVALDLGSKTTFSATEVARAMGEFAQAGFTTKEIVQSIAPAAHMAAAGGADLSMSVQSIATATRAFRMETADAGKIADIITHAANKSITSIPEMTDSLKYAMGTARTAGMTFEETAAALMMLSNAGLRGSEAGTTLRNMLKRTADQSQEARATMKALGITTQDAAGNFIGMGKLVDQLGDKLKGMGPMAQTEAISSMYEIRAGSGFLSLMGQGKQYEDTLAGVQQATGSSERQSAVMLDNVSGSWKQLHGAINATSIELYSFLQGPLKATLNTLRDGANFFRGAGGAGILGGAMTGAGAGGMAASAGWLLSFIPGLGQLNIGLRAVKWLAAAGGLYGFLDSVFGNTSTKTMAIVNPFESVLTDWKKINAASKESTLGINIHEIQQIGKAMLDLSESIKTHTSATRSSIETSSRWYAIQSGGVETLKSQRDLWRSQNKGVLDLAGLQQQRDTHVAELRTAFKMQDIFDTNKPMQAELSKRAFLGGEWKNSETGEVTDPKQWFEGMAYKRLLAILAGPLAAPGELMEARIKRERSPHMEFLKTNPGFAPATKQMAKIHEQLGYQRIIEQARVVDPARFPLPKGPYRESSQRSLAELGAVHTANADIFDKGMGDKPELRRAWSSYLRASEIKGGLDALKLLGDQAPRIKVLQEELKKLNVDEIALYGVRNRAAEWAELDKAMATGHKQLQGEIVHREAVRAEIEKTYEPAKKLADIQQRLWEQINAGAPAKMIQDLQKDYADQARSVQAGLPAEIWKRQIESVGRVWSETRNPAELFGQQADNLKNLLKIPTDLVTQIEQASGRLKAARASAADPEVIQQLETQLSFLQGELGRSTLKYDDFERAVRRAGGAMDQAIGGSRLPPALQEGTAAAVSRINNYAAENDPSNPIMADIRNILDRALQIQQEQKDKQTDIEKNTRDLLQMPKGKKALK